MTSSRKPIKFIALDTETELIATRTNVCSKSGAIIYTSPFVVPDLVLGSTAEGLGSGEILSPGEILVLLLDLVHERDDIHLVFHNVAFDYHVLCKWNSACRELLDTLIEQDRVHDTMLLDNLIGLATGKFDRLHYDSDNHKWTRPELRSRSLDTLAGECFMVLDKDPNIRLGFGQFKNNLYHLPDDFAHYAKQDAVATALVFSKQLEMLAKLGPGFLSEPYQIKAAVAFAELDRRGVAVDKKLAGELHQRFSKDLAPLQRELVKVGIGRWDPKPGTSKRTKITGAVLIESGEFTFVPRGEWFMHGGQLVKIREFKKHAVRFEAEPKFCLNISRIQTLLRAVETNGDLPPMRPSDGTLGLKYDFWVKHVTSPDLVTWLDHEKLKKILSTYLDLYKQTDRVFPRWHILGARSGRVSASGPSIMNVPKRKHGIRALFKPDRINTMSGYKESTFIRADYSAQEMFTLCESMIQVYGIQGPLYETLASGEDIHTYAAALVLGKDPEDITKMERQGQKALNFGVPGGLGAKKLSEYAHGLYGVEWSEEEAAGRRQAFLNVFTDIADYLNFIRRTADTCLRQVSGKGFGADYWRDKLNIKGWNLLWEMGNDPNPDVAQIGLDAQRTLTVTTPSGRVRAHCRFTEGANTLFQGPASDIIKLAVWNCRQAGLDVVMAVHDEIVIQPKSAEVEPARLEHCMLDAFKTVCPNVGQFASVEVTEGLESWGPATDGDGNVI